MVSFAQIQAVFSVRCPLCYCRAASAAGVITAYPAAFG